MLEVQPHRITATAAVRYTQDVEPMQLRNSTSTCSRAHAFSRP